MRFDMIVPGGDIEASAKKLAQWLFPMYQKAWKANGGDSSFGPFNMNMFAFMNNWAAKNFRVFAAYGDDGEPCGFLVGCVFRPIPYEASVFQVEEWWVEGGDDAKRSLFAYVLDAVKFMGCDELWVGGGNGVLPPETALDGLNVRGRFTVVRYGHGK